MKILHIISDMDPKAGGVSQAVRTMIKGLEKLNTMNAVVCLNRDDSSFLAGSAFPVFALGPGSTAWNINGKLQRWLKDHIGQYDAAILHGLWQFQSYALLKSIRFSDKTRLFVMPHGMLDPYFQRAPGRKLKAIRNLIFWNLLERHVIKKAHGMLFTCEAEKLLAREAFNRYHPRAELVVGLGVEPPPPYTESQVSGFLAEFPQQLDTDDYLLYIGRIHPKKGVDMLIEAYLTLKRSGEPNMPQLVIAGPGLETDYGQRIKEMAAGEPTIIFTGMLVGDLKWAAFYGCQAFVLPSHQENFGIAVVEALACGKSVLISNQVNIWREIKRQNAGIISPDTLAGTEEMLKSWIAKPAKEKSAMGIQARQAYEIYFTVEQAAAKLMSVLIQQ